jgi:hypothetical protein
VNNSKQKYRHESTGKTQELTPAVAELFPLFRPVRLEAELDAKPASVEARPKSSAEPRLLTEPAIVPALDTTTT